MKLRLATVRTRHALRLSLLCVWKKNGERISAGVRGRSLPSIPFGARTYLTPRTPPPYTQTHRTRKGHPFEYPLTCVCCLLCSHWLCFRTGRGRKFISRSIDHHHHPHDESALARMSNAPLLSPSGSLNSVFVFPLAVCVTSLVLFSLRLNSPLPPPPVSALVFCVFHHPPPPPPPPPCNVAIVFWACIARPSPLIPPTPD